jgi:hypothetical protein
MISGTHMLLFADDAETARAFLRDTIGLENVDAGDGWLIFALPPAELGVHPVSRGDHVNGKVELWFMCHDLASTMQDLASRGVAFSEVKEESFGSTASFQIPGAGQAWLYEPKHASPLADFSG